MKITQFFEEVKNNMSNRGAMLLDQMFLDRTNDAITLALGRTLSLKLITFSEDGNIARTTELGFNVLAHPKVINSVDSELLLEDLLIIAVKNKVCSEYEPMLSKKYMYNFWEAINSHNLSINTSREIAEIGKELPRAFP